MGLGHEKLDRIAAMLSRWGGRGYSIREGPAVSGDEQFDFDPDSDFGPDEIKLQQTNTRNAHSSRK